MSPCSLPSNIVAINMERIYFAPASSASQSSGEFDMFAIQESLSMLLSNLRAVLASFSCDVVCGCTLSLSGENVSHFMIV